MNVVARAAAARRCNLRLKLSAVFLVAGPQATTLQLRMLRSALLCGLVALQPTFAAERNGLHRHLYHDIHRRRKSWAAGRA